MGLDARLLFYTYKDVEAELEAEPYRPYRDILTATAKAIATRLDLPLAVDRAEMLPALLPTWQPFSDTVEALVRLKQKYRLGVLSNIDRDLFAETQVRLGIDFDFVVTAEDVRSYKPGVAHFNKMLTDHADRESVLHVAQSLYHDGLPARQLDIAFVWINRYNHPNETAVEPLAILPDVKSLADALC